MVLRLRYAMSVTDLAYGAVQGYVKIVEGVDAMLLRACYERPGIDVTRMAVPGVRRRKGAVSTSVRRSVHHQPTRMRIPEARYGGTEGAVLRFCMVLPGIQSDPENIQGGYFR
eukprot:3189239-Rhodomonas_salina.9